MLYMSEMHTACLASRLTCTHFMIHSSHEHSNCAIGGADYRSSCPNACAAVTLCVCLIGVEFLQLNSKCVMHAELRPWGSPHEPATPSGAVQSATLTDDLAKAVQGLRVVSDESDDDCCMVGASTVKRQPNRQAFFQR